MFSEEFEEFYNSLTNGNSILQGDKVSSSLHEDREELLNAVYTKKLCNFLYEHSDVYGKGYTKVLIKYILDGTIKVCSLNEFLYDTYSSLGENIIYSNIFKMSKASVAPYFAKSSLTSFFTDIVNLAVANQNNGLSINIMDFNIMLHLYIMKTKKLKNNTSIWNGVDISGCDVYSESTRVGFRIFRYQYNQQITNEIKMLLNMCINCLNLRGSTKLENNSSLGMLDIVAIDMDSSRFRLDNGYNIVEPMMKELYKHNVKILNVFESKSRDYRSAARTLPKLRVYLCSTLSTDYVYIKTIASHLNVPFPDLYKQLKHIKKWDNTQEIVSPLTSILNSIIEDRQLNTEALDTSVVGEWLTEAEQKTHYPIIDRELYNLCRKYVIPSMEFVVYNWGDKLLEQFDAQTRVKLNDDVVSMSDNDIQQYISQLYVASQSINLMRRLVSKERNYLKVEFTNVPLDKVNVINKILKDETVKLTSEYNDKFMYTLILDNSASLEEARYKTKEEILESRDSYRKKYKQPVMQRGIKYPSGRRISKRRHKINGECSKWFISKKDRSFGKLKIVNDLNENKIYYKGIDSEED